MGFFSALFGTHQISEENKYETLRDDGVRAMQMGELAYAEKCLTAALELNRELRTVGFLAEVRLRQQNYSEAIPLLREISASEGDTLEVDLLLAHALGRTMQYEDEKDVCQAILDAHADEPRALYLLSEALHGLGDELTAVVNLSKCLYAREDYSEARLLRARILKGMGQAVEALEDVNALLEKDAENETYLLLRAQLLAGLGRNDEAQADLSQIITLNPFADEAILLSGQIYEAESLWDKALALYDEAIELRPDFAAAYKARGGVKHHLRDEAGAAEDLKRSLELAPESAKQLDGEYTNVENEMNARYKSMNPYGF